MKGKLSKFALVAFFIMAFDYLENTMIYLILNSNNEIFISLGSLFGVLKAVSTTIVVSMVLAALAIKGVQYGVQNWKKRQTQS